jgi:hypothetical protein
MIQINHIDATPSIGSKKAEVILIRLVVGFGQSLKIVGRKLGKITGIKNFKKGGDVFPIWVLMGIKKI